MTSAFEARLGELQPSQLWISAEKLGAVLEVRAKRPGGEPEPLPVWRMAGRLVLTDGHTRALAAHLDGETSIPARWETDDLDWEAYGACVNWCVEEGVRSVADLRSRVVPLAEYHELWLERCRELHDRLAADREGEAKREDSSDSS